MQTWKTRRRLGFTLLEMLVSAALIAVLWVGSIQMISTFYRYRLADGITSSLLSQSARVQAEFAYFCGNASSIRMSPNQQERTQILTSGNYFEATFTAQSNANAGTNNTLIRGLEYVEDSNSHLGSWREWYYDNNDQPLGPPVTLCMNYARRQGTDQYAFGFRNDVPFMEYRLMLPNNTGSGTVSTQGAYNASDKNYYQQYFDVTAYAKPLFMK
jgi:prepilin-type N-terminal cleavage/methylation domain-containing protein